MLVITVQYSIDSLFFNDLLYVSVLLTAVTGLGLGDILKPDLVLPLMETLPIEQLASYLPEVCNFVFVILVLTSIDSSTHFIVLA
jgi:hypothetical protein